MELLVDLLNQHGLKASQLGGPQSAEGFPALVNSRDAGTFILNLESPAILEAFDKEQFGLAILDPLGYTKSRWGLAQYFGFFQSGRNALDSPIGNLFKRRTKDHKHAIFHDGYRFFMAGLSHAQTTDIAILIVRAKEEEEMQAESRKNARIAQTLRRLGKTLNMNAGVRELSVAAVHEIASAAELAAALLWVENPETKNLDLAASVGVNRAGLGAVKTLSAFNGSGCAAEVVATTRRSFMLRSAFEHVLCSNLEAKFCYLKPGGICVHALETGGRLVGVLELIGRYGDVTFFETGELFETISEHLALALNGATMMESLQNLAAHDALTGLGNHRHMQEFLHHRIAEAERLKQPVSLLMLDVDHFHAFNEEEGHDAGDEVLRLVSDALRACVRTADLAARYGGEEFVVIMPNADLHEAKAVGDRIRAMVSSRPFTTKSGRTAHVTASVGCAAMPDCASDAAGLLKAADMALFDAKRAGRNRTVTFEGDRMGALHREVVPLEKIREQFGAEDWDESKARLGRLVGAIEDLGDALHLSQSQLDILDALVMAGPLFKASSDQASLEANPAFRVLLPSLLALDARFDGNSRQAVEGKKIPLLARATQVLFAVDAGVDLHADPGRFDPDIVAALSSAQAVA